MENLWDTSRTEPRHQIPHNRTETSMKAAESMRPHRWDCLALTLRIIESQGLHGATNEEISRISGGDQCVRFMPIPTVCSAANRLSKDHQIIDSTRRRPGISGRPARVWIRSKG